MIAKAVSMFKSAVEVSGSLFKAKGEKSQLEEEHGVDPDDVFNQECSFENNHEGKTLEGYSDTSDDTGSDDEEDEDLEDEFWVPEINGDCEGEDDNHDEIHESEEDDSDDETSFNELFEDLDTKEVW